jgi:hypothetical protein
MTVTTHEVPKIVSVTLHPTGRMFLATETGIYELDVHNVWQPMKFGVPEEVKPAAPIVEPVA